MSFFKAIIAILGISSMVQCFPPSSEYCTVPNVNFTTTIFFHTYAPDLLEMLFFSNQGGEAGVYVTGTIPWTVDANTTTLFINTTNANLTSFADFMDFNVTEWGRIPYNDTINAFTLSVNGTPTEAYSGRCPKAR
ncbi:hypothetical protein Pmar_PMAR000331 [Perkinsus marinus ATCC 50983]|uniref:Uncharacterized protein n=1 Tax=Perkinsus marinus (strain ATCC 50983 / TXsc) TaxID=423536 RepID=C5L7W7_PERM5|nr:hypothetical protein Pmar_PMAR000331 [Perkinsus marinus ATCC 50983]EER07175.1 hypothetical protein Pmar_PMAR000331 [Perkinsus marinus ATCC 50983]|eukprot:XP_002775359.1 hypothetical protein Pmar_PMAR000331 [Perkinsus marinus ATCC 50983]